MNTKEIVKQVIENEKRLKSCTRHRFAKDLTPDKPWGKRWKCVNCGGEVDNTAKNWYEKGLEHAGVDVE
ncbi:hypothetical protein NST81_02815 [Bacillus sp. FSL W8-0223]|uniref:hypothetical protein n=1 Tax=Bacillus sp. FSL W8-0223 TaxID=2954595 RepID=UPI0030F83A1E